MQTVVIHNCTVEIRVPSPLDMSEMSGPHTQPSVRLVCYEHVHNVLVKMPDGKVMTIKKLFLNGVLGTMLPVIEDDRVVLFTVADEVVASPVPTPDILVENK